MTKYFTNIVKLYSTAFFEYVAKNNNIVNASKDFLKLKDVFAQGSSILESIAAPVYSQQEQIQLLSAVLNKIEVSLDMVNFIQVLLVNKRLELFPLIADYFNLLAHEYSVEKLVEVTLSHQVSSAEKEKIKQELEGALSSKIEVLFKEDKKILAGTIVKIDNKMFDASLRTKFTNLTDSVTKKIALL